MSGLDAKMLLGENIPVTHKEYNQEHSVSLINEGNHKLKLFQNDQEKLHDSLEHPELMRNGLNTHPTEKSDTFLQHKKVPVHSPKYNTKTEDLNNYKRTEKNERLSIVHEIRFDTGGVSLDRGIIVGRRGRSSSAPRSGYTDVVNELPKMTTNYHHDSQNPFSRIHSSHPRDVVGENSIGAGQRGRKSQLINHVHQNIPTRAIHRGERVGMDSLDISDATEIARSTALRLDSAYSAAQCLVSSISTNSLNLCSELPPT